MSNQKWGDYRRDQGVIRLLQILSFHLEKYRQYEQTFTSCKINPL